MLVDSSNASQNDASLYRQIFGEDNAKFAHFSKMISYYTSQNLSFPRDVLRAAQGMLRKYSIFSGLHCFEGMPSPLDQSLLFRLHSKKHGTTCNRREGLPSYSWTGWKCNIRWSPQVAHANVSERHVNDVVIEDPAELRTWIAWHCILADGSIHRINHSGRLRRVLALPTPEHCRLTSPPALQQIVISDNDVDFDTVHVIESPLLLFWTICVKLELVITPRYWWQAEGKNGEICGNVSLDSMIADTTVGEFAILAAEEDSFWALLLQWKNSIAERRGVVQLSRDVLNTSLPPGPLWKAIVLG